MSAPLLDTSENMERVEAEVAAEFGGRVSRAARPRAAQSLLGNFCCGSRRATAAASGRSRRIVAPVSV